MGKSKLKGDDYKEFLELEYLHDHYFEYLPAERLKIDARFLAFIKKHKERYGFTDEKVADLEAKYLKSVALRKEIQVTQLDQLLGEVSEKSGKPFMFPVRLRKKRDSH